MTAAPITAFAGEYRFLSNFYPAAVDLDGSTYPTVEHAYQAAKSLEPSTQAKVKRAPRPGDAKRLGRQIRLRPDWEDVKVGIMRDLVRQKFTSHPDLRARLLATGDAELVEGNYWHDTFWGQCPVGTGFNHLGRILMEVRAELRESR
jgi:ribA/ribD-fused uncharacterized protein